MKWRNYRHRFVPWIAANWSKRLVRQTDTTASLVSAKDAVEKLSLLLTRFSAAHNAPLLGSLGAEHLSSQDLSKLRQENEKTLLDTFGFNLEISSSHMEGSGRGVFVSKGAIGKGQLVALYPGTVYFPFDPIFFQSLNNSFIFRCVDGIHIDGKNTGLSRLIYRSCAFRDVIGRSMTCDVTWLTLRPMNPLSIGQIVNNATKSQANVEYVEMDLPSLPLVQLCYIPSVCYQPHLDSWDTFRLKTRTIGLLATRDIGCGEEIYSSYFTTVIDGVEESSSKLK